MIRALALSLLFTVCATGARAEEPATTLAPLIGCWRGVFDGNSGIHDERCFEPMLAGRHVRDTHFVRPTAYGGETIYSSDNTSDALVFSYYASDGGFARGVFRADGQALVFDAHTYVGPDGRFQYLRSRWTIEGADRFVVTSEVERDGAWRPWGRITYTRAEPSSR